MEQHDIEHYGLTAPMELPYYAVIFTSLRTTADPAYDTVAEIMEQLARQQPGYLGMESARQHIGITVSYWKDEAAIRNWKQQLDHVQAQRLGRERWYAAYRVRVCRVERDYGFLSETTSADDLPGPA